MAHQLLLADLNELTALVLKYRGLLREELDLRAVPKLLLLDAFLDAIDSGMKGENPYTNLAFALNRAKFTFAEVRDALNTTVFHSAVSSGDPIRFTVLVVSMCQRLLRVLRGISVDVSDEFPNLVALIGALKADAGIAAVE